ncbi:MAG: hypothetical protein FJ098_03200, partial [Deltaproteobacteria bacterium]|nr:hypothetical protein [Deltaproteobacteria bacterium]
MTRRVLVLVGLWASACQGGGGGGGAETPGDDTADTRTAEVTPDLGEADGAAADAPRGP